jgi:hypothetical protein
MEKISENKESFDIEKSPMREAYLMLDATTPFELSRNYVKYEQVLFKSGKWDYDNPEQTQNKIKQILESVDASNLTEEEVEWRNEILWFWYHHAISVAHNNKDKEKMKFFSTKALEYQDDNPAHNPLTRTMYLLSHDKIKEAEDWLDSKKGHPDEEYGREIIDYYKKNGWFWPTE